MLPPLGKKLRNAEDNSGASLKSSWIFAKTSACHSQCQNRVKIIAAKTYVVCTRPVTGKDV